MNFFFAANNEPEIDTPVLSKKTLRCMERFQESDHSSEWELEENAVPMWTTVKAWKYGGLDERQPRPTDTNHKENEDDTCGNPSCDEDNNCEIVAKEEEQQHQQQAQQQQSSICVKRFSSTCVRADGTSCVQAATLRISVNEMIDVEAQLWDSTENSTGSMPGLSSFRKDEARRLTDDSTTSRTSFLLSSVSNAESSPFSLSTPSPWASSARILVPSN